MDKDIKEGLAKAFPGEFRRAVLQAVQEGGVRAGVKPFGVPAELISYWQVKEALAEEEGALQGEWPGSLAGPRQEAAGCSACRRAQTVRREIGHHHRYPRTSNAARKSTDWGLPLLPGTGSSMPVSSKLTSANHPGLVPPSPIIHPNAAW